VLSHCEYFDGSSWKTITPMIKRRSNFQVFIYNGKIHAIGGFTGKKNTKSIEYYDETTNIWKMLKLKLQRGLAGFALMPKASHELIIVGGLTQQGSTSACHLVNLKEMTHLAMPSFKE
jgi:N-acetylneuraminic acid mutarotase